MLENMLWAMGGFIACILVFIITVLIQECIEECGRKRIERLVEEFTNRETANEQLYEEDIRNKLAEQKKQIEETARAAREYQAARFDEERTELSDTWYNKGLEDGKAKALEWVKAQVKAGQIIVQKGE